MTTTRLAPLHGRTKASLLRYDSANIATHILSPPTTKEWHHHHDKIKTISLHPIALPANTPHEYWRKVAKIVRLHPHLQTKRDIAA
jgi:hypothetical protein